MSVDPEELTGTKQAVLLVLMAEARPVRNPELSILGPELKKQDRDDLVRRGLIEVTTEGRVMVLELTDRGWATCAAIIGADMPDRPSGQGKALYTVLRALRRHFDRDGLAPGDVFFPLDDNALAGEPDVLGDQVEAKVRAAYVGLAARAGGWVDLVRLREELSDVSQARPGRRVDPDVPHSRSQPRPRGEPEDSDRRGPRRRHFDRRPGQAPDRDRELMDPREKEALSSLRLSWAPTADDLWLSQGTLHVPGFNDKALDEVMSAFADAGREQPSSPLGVVVQGPAGSGKTHLLGQVRERVQAADGFFFVVELLDATSFWESARSSILRSLNRPAAARETQLKELLYQLSSVAHISRVDRKAIIGDDPLTPEVLVQVRERVAHGGPGDGRPDAPHPACAGPSRRRGLRRPGRRAGVPQLR